MHAEDVSHGVRDAPSSSARTSNWRAVVVCRHAERADTVWPNSWSGSKDAKKFPMDPPITTTGIVQARKLAKSCLASASIDKTTIDCIRTSPYLRCVQTALIMAEEFNVDVEIDHRLGEVLNRDICESLSTVPWRSCEELASALEDFGISGHRYQTSRLQMDHARGEPPSWPESNATASLRYATRFMTQLRRTLRTGRSCILVSHGESIKTCAQLMPSTHMRSLCSVDFCGALIAATSKKKSSSAAATWDVSLRHVEHEEDADSLHDAYLKRLRHVQKALSWEFSDIEKVIGSLEPCCGKRSGWSTWSTRQETDEPTLHTAKREKVIDGSPKVDSFGNVFYKQVSQATSIASAESEPNPFDQAAQEFTHKSLDKTPEVVKLKAPFLHASALLKRRTLSQHTSESSQEGASAAGYPLVLPTEKRGVSYQVAL
eukprot:TRINITY_DN17217_c0_g2_i1.p1 TRINITY_DN17217_c0_g2~~TRINITY_DN17217_c0_g2_i1.p1  ORF type:complete len:431 (+),score=71.83 TRINITY_DN17217_c0_g2_i1:122-1414(+)